MPAKLQNEFEEQTSATRGYYLLSLSEDASVKTTALLNILRFKSNSKEMTERFMLTLIGGEKLELMFVEGKQRTAIP